MSEYQYYEFLALDRPLTAKQRAELRSISSRADITATRFVNEYQWGDLKGDPRKMVERYFDAYLYLANWGTRQLMFRLPRGVLDAEAAGQYCGDGGVDRFAGGGGEGGVAGTGGWWGGGAGPGAADAPIPGDRRYSADDAGANGGDTVHVAPTAGSLASRPASTISGLVDRAEKRGLLQRAPNPLDRRSVDVLLSEAGAELAERGAAQISRSLSPMTSALTGAEALRLITLLERMLERERNPSRLLRSDHSQDHPVCIAFRGDFPVEYWSEEEPEEPRPFGINEVNRRLAALGRLV